MNRKRRVLITGHGSVSSLDNSLSSEVDFYNALLEASPEAECGLSTSIRRILDLHSDRFIPQGQLRRLDRLCQMALIASQKGLASAQLTIGPQIAERSGIVFNNCFGPLQSTETYVSKFIREGVKKAPAGLFPYTVVSVATGLVTMNTKALGTNSTVSGANSVCYGLDAIRQGTDDTMLVGGCDEITSSLASWFQHAGYFDAWTESLSSSNGSGSTPGSTFKLGEGAATLILEESASALGRGAQPLAEVIDYGCAHPLRSPHPYFVPAECIEAAILKALANSGVQPEQIGLVVSGANGFQRLDEAEGEALNRVFPGSHLPPAIHVKQSIGETLGASGVFSVIVAAEALHRRTLPAALTRNVHGALPASAPVVSDVEFALVNCYEFGGNINSIVVKKYEPAS